MKTLDDFFGPQSDADKLEGETLRLMFRFLSKIEQVMEAENITKKALATLIGTSPSYITQLFRGNKVINLQTISKIEAALDITFEVRILHLDRADSIFHEDLEIMTKVESSDADASYFSKYYSPILSLAYSNVG